MRRSDWPKEPSRLFHRWVAQREWYRRQHSSAGRSSAVRRDEMLQMYVTLGGLTEASSLEDLARIRAVDQRQQKVQGSVWDADMRELLRAADEGGEEAAWAVGVVPDWLVKHAKKVQPEDPHSEAMKWIRLTVKDRPDNPLIRSDELQRLLKTVIGARQIGRDLRDALILELLDEGVPMRQVAKAAGWSTSKMDLHAMHLGLDRQRLHTMAQSGEVPGVLALRG